MTPLAPTPDEILSEWSQALNSLEAQIRDWSQRQGWTVSARPTDPIVEEDLPPYQVQVVRVQAGENWAEFQPTARLIIGGPGRIDIYSPLHHLMMLRRAEAWPITHADWTVYAGNFPVVRSWTKEGFLSLMETLFVDQAA